MPYTRVICCAVRGFLWAALGPPLDIGDVSWSQCVFCARAAGGPPRENAPTAAPLAIVCPRGAAPITSGFTSSPIGGIMEHARRCPPAKDHPRRNAFLRRARPAGLLRGLQVLALDHLRSPLDLIVTRHAFVAIKSPVCVVDRVLGYPFRKRRLCALRALKKCDLRCQVTIGYDFFHAPNATDLAENSNHGHEHASDPHGDFAARGCARPFSKKWQDGLTPPRLCPISQLAPLTNQSLQCDPVGYKPWLWTIDGAVARDKQDRAAA